jgi:hypothetical protein
MRHIRIVSPIPRGLRHSPGAMTASTAAPRVRARLLAGLTALSVIASFAAAASPASAASPVRLQFAHSGKCLTVPRWSRTVGQPLDQFTCVSPIQANQQWRFFPVPGHPGWNVVQSASSAQCLSIAGRSTVAGASVVQFPCTYADSSEWFRSVASGRTTPFRYILLQNGHSSQCVNVTGASTANGARAIQWPCIKTANNEQIRTW